MKTIWKFPIQVTDKQLIDMPAGAKILTVGMQHGNPYLWALVNDQEGPAPRWVFIVGTGHSADHLHNVKMNTPPSYVGTFQLDGGNLIFHVFA